MNHPSRIHGVWITGIVAAALATAAPLVCAQAAQGASATPPISITGRMPVRQACPAIDTELPDALIKAWNEVATPGTVLVQFTLKGRHIVDVTPLQGPQPYFRHVRWAVRNNLNCDGGGDELRTVRLNVRFVYPGEADGSRSTAALAIDDAPMP